MSGVNFKLKRRSSETMLELSQKIIDEMTKGFFSSEIEVCNIEHVGDTEVLLLGFERYYLRAGSSAAVIIQCICTGDTQMAVVSGLGGETGLLHESWGANEDIAYKVLGILRTYGFAQEKEESMKCMRKNYP